MVLSLQMERKSGFPFAMSITEKDPKIGLLRQVMKLMRRVSSMTLEEPMRKCHCLNPYSTWAQVKNMTRQAEQTLKNTGTPLTPDKLLLAMLAVLSCFSGVSAEYVYWAYISNPPLLSIVHWVDKAPMIFTNDSMHFPSPWSTKRPIHEEDEGKPINIYIGFKTLPICFGYHPLCMTIFPQW